ncbi:MAG: hypothetical protein EXR89_06640 [Methylococcaceae bacterium]|nr:hypothetical protein [Methylococcaceae bacterium]
MLNKTKELVQSLNDNFSLYNIPVIQVVAPVIVTTDPEVVVAFTPAATIASSVQLSTQEPPRKSVLMQKFTRK